MTIGLAALLAYALAIVGVVLLVAGRLVRCGYRATRVARYAIVASCVAGIAALVVLLAWVALVWFSYGVAHSEKNAWTDLRTFALSGVPLFGGAWALWRMARQFEARVEGRGA